MDILTLISMYTDVNMFLSLCEANNDIVMIVSNLWSYYVCSVKQSVQSDLAYCLAR